LNENSQENQKKEDEETAMAENMERKIEKAGQPNEQHTEKALAMEMPRWIQFVLSTSEGAKKATDSKQDSNSHRRTSSLR
jgi:hypothetical protein